MSGSLFERLKHAETGCFHLARGQRPIPRSFDKTWRLCIPGFSFGCRFPEIVGTLNPSGRVPWPSDSLRFLCFGPRSHLAKAVCPEDLGSLGSIRIGQIWEVGRLKSAIHNKESMREFP